VTVNITEVPHEILTDVGIVSPVAVVESWITNPVNGAEELIVAVQVVEEPIGMVVGLQAKPLSDCPMATAPKAENSITTFAGKIMPFNFINKSPGNRNLGAYRPLRALLT
jgi:hypothetical protein